MPKKDTPTLAEWIHLSPNLDARGRLTEIDFHQLPFLPVRAFYIDQVQADTIRGRHAHRNGSQLLICLHGEVEVRLRAGRRDETVICNPDTDGLLIGSGIWAQQRYLTEDSVLLVLSSLSYEEVEYDDEDVRAD